MIVSVDIYNKDVVFKKKYGGESKKFWIFQLAGWGAYTLVTFFSFTYLESEIFAYHYIHLLMQGYLGVLCTWPLRGLFRWSFKLTVFHQITLALIASSFLAVIWTFLRITFFIWISGLPNMWEEFNSWLYGALFVFWSWSAFYFGAKYYLLHKLEHRQLIEEISLKREAQLERLQAESSAREAQLQMLRYQLNPHFLFNTLNAINALVMLQENHKAQEMIQQLSHFLRYSLDNNTSENVPLKVELEMLMLYLNIEKTRFEERLILEFEIEDDARDALIPSFILQPIFENSLKYAVAPSELGGTIRMTAAVVKDKLYLNITDTGSAVISGETEKTRGIGLDNVQKRLQVAYNDKYSFNASAGTSGGFSVKMCIPYHVAADENFKRE